MTIRPMTIEDYDEVYALWNASLASVRDMDDSREAIARFLDRNPGMSVIAIETTPVSSLPPVVSPTANPSQEGNCRIVGSALCGCDGRRGYLYHVAVDAAHRRSGIARGLAEACLAALRAEGISKCALLAFTDNGAGNAFWEAMGFHTRADVNYRDCWL